MKKILCVLFALMLTVVLLFTGCGDKKPVDGSVEDNQGGSVVEGNTDALNDTLGDVKSDVKIEEGESITEQYIAPQVQAFIDGKYYLKGVIYSSGEAMPSIIATDGKNFHFTTDTSGISIGILILDDVTYIIQPNAKIYAELSATLVSALGIDDFDVTEITNIKLDGADNSVTKINQSAVTINGEAGICNEYVYDTTTVRLYSVGDRLIQVDNYDSNGTLTMQIVVNEISDVIPSDQLTLKGLEKSSVTKFITSFMKVQ